MNGRAKIEGLTNAWYGFAVFSTLCSVVINGIGVFSILSGVVGLLISWFITFLFGRALLKRSSLARAFLLVVSGLFMTFGVLGVGAAAYTFIQTFQLRLIGGAVYAAIGTWMYARSFFTLMDRSVKAYIG